MRRTRLVAMVFAAIATVAVTFVIASPASASDAVVSIQNRGNLLCLQPSGASFDAGTAIVQEPCVNISAQSWDFVPLGGTSFRIRNIASGLCLDALGGASNGTPIVQWPCTNISNEKWDTGRQLPDIVTLTSQVAGTHSHCLDVPGAQDVAGLAMQLFACNGTSAQSWGAGIMTIIQA